MLCILLHLTFWVWDLHSPHTFSLWSFHTCTTFYLLFLNSLFLLLLPLMGLLPLMPSGWGLLYGLCSQPTHSFNLLLPGQFGMGSCHLWLLDWGDGQHLCPELNTLGTCVGFPWEWDVQHWQNKVADASIIFFHHSVFVLCFGCSCALSCCPLQYCLANY